MKHLLIRGIALSLGLLATSARGQETVWRSTPATPGATTPVVDTGKPIAIAVSRPVTPQPTPPAAPTVSIGRPVALAGSDAAVRPVSFAGTPDATHPIVRGAAPDSVSRPMPSTIPPVEPSPIPPMGQGTWRRSDDVVLGASRTVSDPIAPAVAMSNTNVGGTIMPNSTSDPLGMPPPVVGGQPVHSGPPSSLFGSNPNCGCGGVKSAPAVDCGCGCGKSGPVVDCAPGCGGGRAFVGGRMIAGSAGSAGGTCGGGMGVGGGVVGGGGGGAGNCSGGGGFWGRYVEPMFAGMGDPDGGMNAPRLVLSAEYLLWWAKGDQTPPLAVSVPVANGVPAGGATTLIGGGNLGNEAKSGVRASAIYWFCDERFWGIELGGFLLGPQNNTYNAGGGAGANPVIGRPFFDTSVGGAAALELVAGLGILQGNVQVVHRETLWGADLNLRRNLYNDCSFTMDLLFGFRQVGLDESLSITENLTQTAAVGRFPAGSTFLVNDKFATSNRFYGGQVGLAGTWRFCEAWSLGFTGKVGIGNTQQTATITGSTTVNSAGVTQTLPGGLLTQAGTNIGRYSQNRFSVVPEVGLTLGYDITDWWRITAGYNFLYWSNVMRPGDQVNLSVNRTLLPFRGGNVVPGAQPAFPGRTNDYYAQGVTFGMLFSF